MTPQGLVFSPDGKNLASAGSFAVQLWEVASGKLLQRWGNSQENVALVTSALTFSADGRLLAAVVDDKIHLWNTNNGKQLRTFPIPEIRVQSLVFSPDGKMVTMVGAATKPKTWEVATGKELGGLQPVKLPEDSLPELATLSPDGKVMADVDAKALHLWDTVAGKPLCSIPGESLCIFSPDARS